MEIAKYPTVFLIFFVPVQVLPERFRVIRQHDSSFFNSLQLLLRQYRSKNCFVSWDLLMSLFVTVSVFSLTNWVSDFLKLVSFHRLAFRSSTKAYLEA